MCRRLSPATWSSTWSFRFKLNPRGIVEDEIDQLEKEFFYITSLNTTSKSVYFLYIDTIFENTPALRGLKRVKGNCIEESY